MSAVGMFTAIDHVESAQIKNGVPLFCLRYLPSEETDSGKISLEIATAVLVPLDKPSPDSNVALTAVAVDVPDAVPIPSVEGGETATAVEVPAADPAPDVCLILSGGWRRLCERNGGGENIATASSVHLPDIDRNCQSK